jgi:aminopeptidase N
MITHARRCRLTLGRFAFRLDRLTHSAYGYTHIHTRLAMKFRPIHAAVLALAGAALPVLAAPTPTQLPRNAEPRHYDITITPDAAASRFAGHALITLDVLAPTSAITLNAADLKFGQATLAPASGSGAPQKAAVRVDAARQTATFGFARKLAKGQYKLAIDYTGPIGQQAVGLFSLDYDGGHGKQRALYTQFENSDARRMIPSWDEPAHKATFTLEAIVPALETAVSNMPVASTRALPDGRKAVTFAQTPRMSTYLLFFGLGDFDRATAMADGTEIGVVTRKGNAAQAAFALEAATQAVREYNDYFGIRYPLPKLDNIAAPGRSQFFGAMENWGAIMTFESGILLDPSISTQSDKEEVFAFAAHEIAHQWFGNLVTMRWWDDLWLNEGFATWMEGRTSAKLHPEWETSLLKVGLREGAMQRDADATSHPIVQHIRTVEQASQAFDVITYQKGAAVIGMLEAYVGADAWREGVRSYMRHHAYGNTVSDDLWREVELAARKPVTAIAHDFTLQAGVPMIRVDDVSCSGGKTSIRVEQQEFSRDRPEKKALHWRVPVSAQLAGSGSKSSTLVDGKATLSMDGCGAVVVNAGQSGYYRTLYAPKAFAALASQFGTLAPIDQLGVLADSWALGLTGLQKPSDFLDLASAAPLSANPQVWERIADTFQSIAAMYGEDAKRRKPFEDFAVARLSPVLAQTGWEARAGEADAVANLRETLVYALARLGDPATIAHARRLFAEPEKTPVALRKVVREVAALKADAATWDALHAQALAEKTPLIKNQFYELLASSEDPALARRAMELAMTDEPGVTNSAAMLNRVAARHPDMAFDFALAHVDKVNERVDATSRSRFFPNLAQGSADPAMPGKLKAYAEKHLASSARGEAGVATAAILDRIKVRKERLPAIEAWLAGKAG